MNDLFKSRDVLKVGKQEYVIFRLDALEKAGLVKLSKLPYSIRVVLEAARRQCNDKEITQQDVKNIAAWTPKGARPGIPFLPGRVVMQDFTGVPAVVDLAAMRAAVARLGGDPKKINPLVPVDLVIDHSVQVDFFATADALNRNTEVEFQRNRERYEFLKWGQKAFTNFRVVPPMTGIVHQVNLENLAEVVMTKVDSKDVLAFPDTVVGTDSHTTMINGLGVVGWGVGGIEAEAVMLGQPMDMLLPDVIGFKLTGKLNEGVTATDLVLTVTQILRKVGVVDKFVEFCGEGLNNMSLTDRATIANMAPEYGATMGYFPVDEDFRYMRLTGRSEEVVARTEAYMRAQGLFREANSPEPEFTGLISLDLASVMPSLAGPKRPQDRVTLANMKETFRKALSKPSKPTKTVVSVESVVEFEKFVSYRDNWWLIFPDIEHEDESYKDLVKDVIKDVNEWVKESESTKFGLNYSGVLDVVRKAIDTNLNKEYFNYSHSSQMFSPVPRQEMKDKGKELFEEVKKRLLNLLNYPKTKIEIGTEIGFYQHYNLDDEALKREATYTANGTSIKLKHGAVVIAAITSCTNTSNPSVLIAAGLVAKKAVEKGLNVKPYVKTSLAPGSLVVTEYLKKAGLIEPLSKLGFNVIAYGCTTCIGNSGPLPGEVAKAVTGSDIVAAAVISGNRNFEGRVHPLVKANYLASPPLVVAYALAGTVDIDLVTEPLGTDKNGQPVYLKDLWPSQKEISDTIAANVKAEMFKEKYADVFSGSDMWKEIKVKEGDLFEWSEDSTYIHHPPYFQTLTMKISSIQEIKDARVLGMFGDSITTDHISPAGNIAADSPAGKFLQERGVQPKDFNQYGTRRGNDLVMARGTFANIRLKNVMVAPKEGNWTKWFEVESLKSKVEEMPIYDAAMKYKEAGIPTIILAGKEYGTGSSRDWAAKGPLLQGVKAVIAESFERIHRSNLVGMGILPLRFAEGKNAESLGLDGSETFDIAGLSDKVQPQSEITVKAKKSDGTVVEFKTTVLLNTEVEVNYYRNGGILHTVLRNLVK